MKSDFVRVKDYIPDIYVELRYATERNFTHTKVYDFDEAYLRRGTTLKLKKVQEELKEIGYSLKIWDAYRPFTAQQYFWELNVVDVTLVKSDGSEIDMPTEFDDFTSKASRDYSWLTGSPLKHVLLLEETMEKYGFIGYEGEWWHYTDEDAYEYIEFNPNERHS